MPARDYLGQELEVGDLVVCITTKYTFDKGFVKKVREEDNKVWLDCSDIFLFGHQVIKIGVLINDEV
jgi:hypothetical protein